MNPNFFQRKDYHCTRSTSAAETTWWPLILKIYRGLLTNDEQEYILNV
jgi:hypothetical protein